VLRTLVRHGIKNLPSYYTFHPQLEGEGGVADPRWLNKKDWRNELNRSLAATAQAVLEKSLHHFIEQLAETMRPMTRNLCLSGGTMRKCVNNGKLLHSGLFDRLFTAPACGDDGLAVGAGLHLATHFEFVDGVGLVSREGPRLRYGLREAFEGGRRYSLEEIQT